MSILLKRLKTTGVAGNSFTFSFLTGWETEGLISFLLFTTFIIMFYLIQVNPTDKTLIGSFKSKERVEFVKEYLQLHNPHGVYHVEQLN